MPCVCVCRISLLTRSALICLLDNFRVFLYLSLSVSFSFSLFHERPILFKHFVCCSLSWPSLSLFKGKPQLQQHERQQSIVFHNSTTETMKLFLLEWSRRRIVQILEIVRVRGKKRELEMNGGMRKRVKHFDMIMTLIKKKNNSLLLLLNTFILNIFAHILSIISNFFKSFYQFFIFQSTLLFSFHHLISFGLIF